MVQFDTYAAQNRPKPKTAPSNKNTKQTNKQTRTRGGVWGGFGGAAPPRCSPGAPKARLPPRAQHEGAPFQAADSSSSPSNMNRLTKSFGRSGGNEQINIVIQLIMLICSGGYRDSWRPPCQIPLEGPLGSGTTATCLWASRPKSSVKMSASATLVTANSLRPHRGEF